MVFERGLVHNSTNTYQEVQPSKILEKYVKCFWICEGTNLESISSWMPLPGTTVLPYGSMELSFHYIDNSIHPIKYDNLDTQPRSFVSGLFTKPQMLNSVTICGIIGVRFYPDGAYPFLKFPAYLLTDKAISLDLIWGKEALELEEKIYNAKSNNIRIEILQNFLISQLRNKYTNDRTVNEAIKNIIVSKGQIGIKKLSEGLYISNRQLERKFKTMVGVGPKFFSRITRLQHIVYLLFNGKGGNLTSIAYENGYHDQAHFINDFKELSGVNPMLYLPGRNIIPGIDFGDVVFLQ